VNEHNDPYPSSEVDPGEPLSELAEVELRTSEDFLERLFNRVDIHHAKLHAAEFTLFSAGAVLREYLGMLLAAFGAGSRGGT
jgi:hypothetical protein